MVNRQSWIALVFRVRGGILLCLCGVKCRFSAGAKYHQEEDGYWLLQSFVKQFQLFKTQ